MFGTISNDYQRRSSSLSKQTPTSFSPYSSKYTLNSPQQLSLKQKVNKIALLNLKQHDLDICACEQCIYGRQLNRKRQIKLQLSKNSSYRQQYQQNQSGIKNEEYKINYDAIQRDKHSKSLVVDNSNYRQVFPERTYDKPLKARPQDQLKFNGPVKAMSAYDEQYHNFKNNANPYVKPTEVRVPNQIKMNTKSSYQANYSSTLQSPTESGKIKDQLHIGLPWTGGSTYRQLFTDPQKSELSQIDISRERSGQDNNFKHQYQTIYRNEYLKERKQRCRRGTDKDKNPLLAALTCEL